ncbi:uncharacterized protein [Halyomorpha halys]|uniref:uncharacterized protein n=1 Tax=Halyomorpha halys TaxID=286706 RepID=UPI0034D2CB1F
MDSKLNWQFHVERTSMKALRCLWACKGAVGKSWGFKPKVIYRLYMAAIRPIVLYAAIVWWLKATTRKSQTWLGKLQRLACLMITGAISTTPSATMEILLNIKRLHIEIEAQGP